MSGASDMRDWILDLFIREDKSQGAPRAGNGHGATGRDWDDAGLSDEDRQAAAERHRNELAVWMFRPPWPGRSDADKARDLARLHATGRPMSRCFPLDWYLYVVRHHYFQFSGRAGRRECMFFLAGAVLLTGLSIILDGLLLSGGASGWLLLLAFLFSLAPSLGVAIRRLHDIDKSGWWLLIALIPFLGVFMLLFWAACLGDRGPNAYGDPPG